MGVLATDRDAHLLCDVLARVARCVEEAGERDAALLVSLRWRDKAVRAAVEELERGGTLGALGGGVVFLDARYEATFGGQAHSPAGLDAICAQRNEVRTEAARRGAPWLLFVDSDVRLPRDGLALLLRSARLLVGIPYMPRWARHVVVGVRAAAGTGGGGERGGGDGGDEAVAAVAAEQMLVNPETFERTADGPVAVPCLVLGFGATLVRAPLLGLAFRVVRGPGGVSGEDVGFCTDAAASGHRAWHPHVLLGVAAGHENGGAHPRPMLPDSVPRDRPLLSRARTDQLPAVEAGAPVKWEVTPAGSRAGGGEAAVLLRCVDPSRPHAVARLLARVGDEVWRAGDGERVYEQL